MSDVTTMSPTCTYATEIINQPTSFTSKRLVECLVYRSLTVYAVGAVSLAPIWCAEYTLQGSSSMLIYIFLDVAPHKLAKVHMQQLCSWKLEMHVWYMVPSFDRCSINRWYMVPSINRWTIFQSIDASPKDRSEENAMRRRVENENCVYCGTFDRSMPVPRIAPRKSRCVAESNMKLPLTLRAVTASESSGSSWVSGSGGALLSGSGGSLSSGPTKSRHRSA